MATKENLTQSAGNLAKFIDHTLLKPDATSKDIEKLCNEAIEFGFFAICVNPTFVQLSRSLLRNSDIKVCTVVGFPLGAQETSVKAYETKVAIEQGAEEIDMVINLGLLKDGQDKKVYYDIARVVEAAEGRTVKVILETCLLSKDEIQRACNMSQKAHASFVKTSTGFSSRGATLEDVQLMHECVGDRMQIKASGGIRDTEAALQMINAGASRLGTSSGIAIIQGQSLSPGAY